MALVGDITKLRDLAARLRSLPVVLAQNVARAVAPELTGVAQADFEAGRTADGGTRPLGVRGNALSLVQSGITQASIRFVDIGTRVRAVLGARYAKYLVGKYGILPKGPLPRAWATTIDATARAEIAKGLAN